MPIPAACRSGGRYAAVACTCGVVKSGETFALSCFRVPFHPPPLKVASYSLLFQNRYQTLICVCARARARARVRVCVGVGVGGRGGVGGGVCVCGVGGGVVCVCVWVCVGCE
jgi:hypothetical protein